MVVRLTLLLQNLTHYGDSVKNFKFLKEVKILSNFVQNKLACLIIAVQITKKLTVTVAIYPVALCSVRGMER